MWLLKGDSAIVIDALQLGTGELFIFGNILSDIHVQASAFQCIAFNYVSRVCNSVVDALAKKVSFNVGFRFGGKTYLLTLLPLCFVMFIDLII